MFIELDNYLSSQLQPLVKDDPILHQLTAETSGAGRYSYELSQNEKIRIYTVPGLIETNFIVNTLDILVLRITREGRHWFRFRGDYAELHAKCKEANLLIEEAFLRPQVRAFKCEQWNNYNTYIDTTHSAYDIIRKEIADEAAHVALADNRNNKPIRLVDLGTGLGECLDLTTRTLVQYGTKVDQAIGIDITNAENAKRKYSATNYEFIAGDLANLDKLIARDPNRYVLCTASGSLTRKVLDSTVVALKVLQQVFRIADAIVVGGGTEVLFTLKLMSRLGWQTSYQLSSKERQIFKGTLTLTKPLSPIIPKFKSAHLNLSFHAHPSTVLSVFLESNKITSIDLGMSYVKPDEVDTILKLLPNLKTISISGTELFADQLLSLAKNRSVTVNINQSAYLTENKLEIQKFSPKFLSKLSGIKSFTKKVEELSKTVNSDPYTYGSHEQGLKQLFQSGDVAAAYRLATYLEEQKQFEESLFYWKTLYAKCYPVLNEIDRVNHALNRVTLTAELLS